MFPFLFSVFLIAAYPEYEMGLYCILSAIPDSIGEFPYSLFLLEYNRMKKDILAHDPNEAKNFTIGKTLALVPRVLYRVVTNVVVLGMVLALILHVVLHH